MARLMEDANPQRQATTIPGGVYTHPFKMAKMIKEVLDKSSAE